MIPFLFKGKGKLTVLAFSLLQMCAVEGTLKRNRSVDAKTQEYAKSNQNAYWPQKILQNFSDSPSHRIFGHMHEALNIDKK
jgi:hypothetical protein